MKKNLIINIITFCCLIVLIFIAFKIVTHIEELTTNPCKVCEDENEDFLCKYNGLNPSKIYGYGIQQQFQQQMEEFKVNAT